MRQIWFTFIAVCSTSIWLQAQSEAPTQPSQTARQALIEMFMGKSPDAFAKHLPQMASKALIHKGDDSETSVVQKISMIGKQMAAHGHVETFDEGLTLLLWERDEGKERVRTEMIS